jgi:hypothetical protein
MPSLGFIFVGNFANAVLVIPEIRHRGGSSNPEAAL